jgi:hypothetical protein
VFGDAERGVLGVDVVAEHLLAGDDCFAKRPHGDRARERAGDMAPHAVTHDSQAEATIE